MAVITKSVYNQVCGMTDFSKPSELLNKFADILRHRFHCATSLFPNLFCLFCFIGYCKIILNNALPNCLIEILFYVFRKPYLFLLGCPFHNFSVYFLLNSLFINLKYMILSSAKLIVFINKFLSFIHAGLAQVYKVP